MIAMMERFHSFCARLLRCYRFFTPHYWRLRAYRREVARQTQSLLPLPYDPCAIELQCRSTAQSTFSDSGVPESEWSNIIMEKLGAKALDRRLATAGAAEIGAYMAEDIHNAFASVDQDVIAAIAHRTGETIHSFSDLGHALSPHTIGERIKSAFSSVDTYEAGQSFRIGDIGESAVLRHLHEAGVDSHLAPHLNTPEWDLTLWNHVANVKTWSDVSDLSSHFERYTNTPVFVPADAMGTSADALHLDPATGQGLQAIHDALDAHAQGLVIVDESLSSFLGPRWHPRLRQPTSLEQEG
jgi:hypothetical protein